MNYASQNAPRAPELCVTGESEKGEIQEFVCSLRAALCGIKIMVSVLVGDRDVVDNYSPRLKKISTQRLALCLPRSPTHLPAVIGSRNCDTS